MRKAGRISMALALCAALAACAGADSSSGASGDVDATTPSDDAQTGSDATTRSDADADVEDADDAEINPLFPPDPYEIYASPAGSGKTCVEFAPCALETARDLARSRAPTMARDLHVNLFGGTYALATTLVLDARDSGTSGHAVIFRAVPGQAPVLSGGTAITSSWTRVGEVFHTDVPATLASRQLYVDGKRATRARGPTLPAGFTKTATGYTTTDASLAGYGNVRDLESVGFQQWKSFRCGVASIVGNAIAMKEPCWSASQAHKGAGFDYTMSLPQWLENARELLDEEGEWYLDRTAHQLHYRPRLGEDLSKAQVIVPTLEVLVRGEGTLDAPIHDVVFRGLTFAYATWLRPSTDVGYAPLQAGVTTIAGGVSEKTPANVAFSAAMRVRFEDDVFTHLGAVALSFDRGSQGDAVVGCRFEDVSSGAIELGDVTHVTDHHPTDPRDVVKGNTIADSFIDHVSVEYHDVPAIFCGFVDSTRIEHNELFDLPYTGISVGWGWGGVDPGGGTYTTPSTARGNVVIGNQISHHMRTLNDGGAIYVLGAQPGSQMTDNYARDQGDPYGALYLDNGSQGWTVTKNVVARAPYWLLVQPGAPVAKNNDVEGNYADRDNAFSPGKWDPSNVVKGNVIVAGAWPAAALSIVDASGLLPAHRSMHPPDVALGKPVSASSTFDVGHPASAPNDGQNVDGWSPLSTDSSSWWQVDLGASYAVSTIEIAMRWGYDQPETRRNFVIWGSDDPTFATKVVLGEQGGDALPHRSIFTAHVAAGAPKVRYVRIAKTKPEYFFLAEVRVLAMP